MESNRDKEAISDTDSAKQTDFLQNAKTQD